MKFNPFSKKEKKETRDVTSETITRVKEQLGDPTRVQVVNETTFGIGIKKKKTVICEVAPNQRPNLRHQCSQRTLSSEHFAGQAAVQEDFTRASDLAVTQQQKEKETLMVTSTGAPFLAGAPVTHFVTFLVGAAVVVAGNYVNSKRRER